MKQSITKDQDVEIGTSIWLTLSSGKPEPEEPPAKETDPEKPGEGTFPLAISLPTDKDKVAVVIQKTVQGGLEVVFSQEVNTSEGSILVNVQGTGTEIFEIYIDNELYDRVEITFE
jgi:serine/threonine-protein kinase